MSLELHLYLSPGITSSNLFYVGISNCSGSRFPVLVFMSGHNIAFGRDLRPAVTVCQCGIGCALEHWCSMGAGMGEVDCIVYY